MPSASLVLTPEQRSGFVDSKYALLEHHMWAVGKDVDDENVFVITEPDLKKPTPQIKKRVCKIVFQIERDGPIPTNRISSYQVTWNEDNGFGIVLPKDCWFVNRLRNIHRVIDDEDHTKSFKPESIRSTPKIREKDKYDGWVDPDFYDDGENLPKYFHRLIGGKRKDKQNFDAAIKAYYKMFKVFSHDRSAGKVFISPITRSTLVGSPLLDVAFRANPVRQEPVASIDTPHLVFHQELERRGYWLLVNENPSIIISLSE